MHDLSVSDIHGYMIDAGTAGVKQQVARLHLTGVHCVTLGCLRTGRTVHADACAMLHDVGKIMELSDFPENDYTDEGQLLGHIFIGAELIRDTAAKIEGFPQKLVMLLMHCILSHHGELEYGSPKVPETIEAFILHCADNMYAKTKMFEEMLAADNTQGSWAGYHRMLARNIRKSDYK